MNSWWNQTGVMRLLPDRAVVHGPGGAVLLSLDELRWLRDELNSGEWVSATGGEEPFDAGKAADALRVLMQHAFTTEYGIRLVAWLLLFEYTDWEVPVAVLRSHAEEQRQKHWDRGAALSECAADALEALITSVRSTDRTAARALQLRLLMPDGSQGDAHVVRSALIRIASVLASEEKRAPNNQATTDAWTRFVDDLGVSGPTKRAAEKIVGVLRDDGYAPEEVHLDVSPKRRIGGYIISSRFCGMSQLARQNMLLSRIEAAMDDDTRPLLGAILTMTPDEVDESEPVGPYDQFEDVAAVVDATKGVLGPGIFSIGDSSLGHVPTRPPEEDRAPDSSGDLVVEDGIFPSAEVAAGAMNVAEGAVGIGSRLRDRLGEPSVPGARSGQPAPEKPVPRIDIVPTEEEYVFRVLVDGWLHLCELRSRHTVWDVERAGRLVVRNMGFDRASAEAAIEAAIRVGSLVTLDDLHRYLENGAPQFNWVEP